MRLEVFRKTLRDERRALLIWIATTATLAFLIALIYPVYSKQAEVMQRFWEEAPAVMKAFFGEEFDFGTPEGFLGAEVYSTMAPLIFAILAIGAGSRAIAGEEQEGTLDVLMAHPLSRRRIVVEKFAAMIVSTMLVAAALAGAIVLAGVSLAMLAIAALRFERRDVAV